MAKHIPAEPTQALPPPADADFPTLLGLMLDEELPLPAAVQRPVAPRLEATRPTPTPNVPKPRIPMAETLLSNTAVPVHTPSKVKAATPSRVAVISKPGHRTPRPAIERSERVPALRQPSPGIGSRFPAPHISSPSRRGLSTEPEEVAPWPVPSAAWAIHARPRPWLSPDAEVFLAWILSAVAIALGVTAFVTRPWVQ